MKLERAINIDDLRRQAKARLPRIIFDFIEGGVEDEHCLRNNAAAFSGHRFLPRYYGDIGPVTQSTTIFGQEYAAPFGIGPTGLAGLFRPNADIFLAKAAARARIPFVLSTVSNASLEEIARISGDYTWFQLYGARDRGISADLIRRAADCGIRTLVVTVDTPVSSKRERNMRNGFSRPLRMRLPILLEALTHPAWVYGYLRGGGAPMFRNWAAYAPPGADRDQVAAFSATQTPNRQTWKDLEATRRLWPHNLVVKGIMHPDDARAAIAAGADGIIVSNHGGRVLDHAPHPIEVLPMIKDAVGESFTLMLDSGVRRGSDILVALCLGTHFVFVGRATLYGVVAGAQAGAQKAIDLLRKEIDIALGQIGCETIAGLGPHFLFDDFARRNARSRPGRMVAPARWRLLWSAWRRSFPARARERRPWTPRATCRTGRAHHAPRPVRARSGPTGSAR